MGDSGVDRRMFLGLAGAGAGAALAMPELAFAARPSVDVAGLEHTFSIEEMLLRGTVAPPVQTVAGWDADKLFNQAAATMLWSARVQKSSLAERESPELRAAIEARMDGMLRTLWATALELDVLEGDALLETEAMILDDPGLLQEAELEFTLRALERDVSSEEVRQLDRGLEKTLWRIEHRGLASVRDDMISKLDKVARRDGFDWRAEARVGALAPFVDLRGQVVRVEDEVPYLPQSEEYYYLRDRARRQSTTGAVMLGIGVLWMSHPYALIFGGICFGPPLIIAGIVKLVAAGKKNRKAREILEAERAGAAPVPEYRRSPLDPGR